MVSREQLKAVLYDAGRLGGLGDGINIGCGRFEVVSYEELDGTDGQVAPRELGEERKNGRKKECTPQKT